MIDELLSKATILNDYRLIWESRHVSYLTRKEVFMGKAKFGITGDGKELAQIAMAKAFQKGDWRSGYYRDQTISAALGHVNWQQYFAQLYAHTDIEHEPSSGGRSMNGHYGNRWFDENGNWKNQIETYNAVVDIAPTAGQIPRAVGLGYASKLYRQNPELKHLDTFSKNGNEICFATIGDASTSQGMFLESINAAGVLQIPVIFSIWDDGFGISVPVEYQTTKSSISKALAGFQRNEDGLGLEIITAKAHDYLGLIEAYQEAAHIARTEHVPVLMHIQEATQPQGHSASGSHERYKKEDRLEWEKAHDCNEKFKSWILENNHASLEELNQIEKEAESTAKKARNDAWKGYRDSIEKDLKQVIILLQATAQKSQKKQEVLTLINSFQAIPNALRRDIIACVKKVIRLIRNENSEAKNNLLAWLNLANEDNKKRYNTDLYTEKGDSPLNVAEIKPNYGDNPVFLDGREIINDYFDKLFARDVRVFAIGEDVGQIGDVNQGFAGLQDKYGDLRITDTGIRETTIIGQGIGAAMRGLRPIVEIQYFDYIFYALDILTDDLASLRYRTAGGQAAPLIIRTRGHRLEGIWHSGSPMAAMIHTLRGLHVLVPRNFVQAAGFYNTLMQGNDPALVVECLNGYRQKEQVPNNLGDICLPLGVPEILRSGNDVTIVTYGSMCRIVMEAAQQLTEIGISCEVIDVQSLLPFDVHFSIIESIKKTNRVIFADEDVPGGASAYMMQEVLEKQGAYQYLDSSPKTISAQAHRPAYSSDGDYFSKPNIETVFDAVYELMSEIQPKTFIQLYYQV